MVNPRGISRVSLLLVLLALLAACGGSATPAATQPTAAPASSSAASSAQPTAAPAAAPTAAAPASTPAGATRSSAGGARGTIGASGEGSVDTSGEYIADFGFRPDYDGFAFPNYGGDTGAINLTAAEVQRMFGDQVCAFIEDDETCVLTPAGEQWVEALNNSMDGGHCEGMAVLSTLFYTQQLSVADFGAESVSELQIEGNEPLQREIAYWFTTQATMPAREGIVMQTPSGIVNTLMTAFEAGPDGSETYAVGFYKRDRSGGHAVTPYAVEDRGDGIYWIMVYDNNYPNAARAIEVDTNTDTWSYSGSTNPSEPADDYEGDAETFTLELAAIEPRLTTQACPFCDGEDGEGSAERGSTGGTLSYNQVWLEGDGDLLITDLEGRSIGFRDGTFVNEIPGATSSANKFGVDVWDVTDEPVYYLPADLDFSIEIDGSQLEEPTTSAVTLIGPGYVLEVSDILLEPGQVDVLDVAPDGSLLSYRTETGETPVLLVGIETEAADYAFAVQGYALEAGEAVNLSLDTEAGWLSLDSIDNNASALYSLYVERYDDAGVQVFGAEDVELAPDDVIYVDYLKWAGNGQPMELDVDRGADGEVDETLQISDVTDEMVETE